MNFLTQGFTRGFFRNTDVRSAELKIMKFTTPRARARAYPDPFYITPKGVVDKLQADGWVPPRRAVMQTTRMLLEEPTYAAQQREPQSRCEPSFLNEGNNYGQ